MEKRYNNTTFNRSSNFKVNGENTETKNVIVNETTEDNIGYKKDYNNNENSNNTGNYQTRGDYRGGRGEYRGGRGEYRGGNSRGEYRGGNNRGDGRGEHRGEYRGGNTRGEYRGGNTRGEYRGGNTRGEYRGGNNRGEYRGGNTRGGYGNNNYNNNYKNNYNNFNNYEQTAPTHFVNIPIFHPDFINSYNKLTDTLIGESSLNLNKLLMQKPTKLHITVCVLYLYKEEEVKAAQEALDELFTQDKEVMETLVKGLNLKVNEFKSMQENLFKTRVIYADIEEDKSIRLLIHKIIEKLFSKKVVDAESLKRSHVEFDEESKTYRNKIHCTLLNVLFLNKIEKKQGKQETRNVANAEEVLKYMNQSLLKTLPEVKMNNVNFSIMREDRETEKYICLKDYKF